MPVYDYECPDCGVFTAFRPMSAFRDPCACPECGREATRVFLTMPGVAGMDATKRTAMATNERAASEPKRSHGGGCSCCSTTAKTGGAAAKTEGAAKGFPKARPWMISH